MLQAFLALLDTNEEKDRFLLIYETYRDLMFYIAQKFLENQADREETVDAALFSLLDLLPGIQDPLNARTKNLIVVVTKNKCLDMLRKQNGFTEEELAVTAERQISIPLPGDGALADAIASLRDPSRDMIFLRYMHGYTAPEIAKLLGISRDAAIKRLQRAKQELKGLLENEL